MSFQSTSIVCQLDLCYTGPSEQENLTAEGAQDADLPEEPKQPELPILQDPSQAANKRLAAIASAMHPQSDSQSIGQAMSVKPHGSLQAQAATKSGSLTKSVKGNGGVSKAQTSDSKGSGNVAEKSGSRQSGSFRHPAQHVPFAAAAVKDAIRFQAGMFA